MALNLAELSGELLIPLIYCHKNYKCAPEYSDTPNIDNLMSSKYKNLSSAKSLFISVEYQVSSIQCLVFKAVFNV